MMIKYFLCFVLFFSVCLAAKPENKNSEQEVSKNDEDVNKKKKHKKRSRLKLFDSAKLAKSVVPAVVDVFAYREKDEHVYMPFEMGDLETMLFGGQRFGNSSGTGCIISSDGIIVTCNHVVEQANRISVGLNDGRKLKATKIFSSAKDDIAFLKVDAKDLPFLKLADSKAPIDQGEPVLVAGNAFGMGKTSVFCGIVSFINRVIDGKITLQSDVNIGVGNSGGPMVNSIGDMIGMAFAIPRSGGLSFFIPSGMITHYYNKEILKKPSPWWGMQVQAMTPDMLESCGLIDKNIFGVIIKSFAQGSRADKILKKGDVILEINGQKISSPEELEFFEKTSAFGGAVHLTVWRDNQQQKLELIPIEEPKSSVYKAENKLLGNVQFEKTSDGVVVKQAEDDGLFEEGDIVLGINNTKIKTPKDINDALKEKADGLSVIINRNGAEITQSFSAGNGGSFFSQRIIQQ